MEAKCTEFPYTPALPAHCTKPPPLSTSLQSGTFITIYETALIHRNYPESMVHLRFPLGVEHSLGSEVWVMPRGPHCSIMWSRFPALTCSCLSLTRWQHRSFYCSSVLSFPECGAVGITWYAASLGGLLSLSTVHLEFFHVFSWLYNYSF